MLSNLLNKIKFSTNLTAEKTEPAEPFRLEGFKFDDFLEHEHINFLFNAYYQLFNEINNGEGVFSSFNTLTDLENIDTTALTGAAWSYVKGFGVYGFVSDLTPVSSTEYLIKPATGSGGWLLKLPDPELSSHLQSYETGLLRLDINKNKYKISDILKKITNLFNIFDNTPKIITRRVYPTINYSSIAGTSEKTFYFKVDGAAKGDNASVTPSTDLNAGLIISHVVCEGNSVGIKLRNTTGSSITPVQTDFTITVFKKGNI